MGRKAKQLFKKGAWLWTPDTIDKELTEEELVEKAGRKKVQEIIKRGYRFISFSFHYRFDYVTLIGHHYDHTIQLCMKTNGHTKYQTMEVK